jgi:hypothetical protein
MTDIEREEMRGRLKALGEEWDARIRAAMDEGMNIAFRFGLSPPTVRYFAVAKHARDMTIQREKARAAA